MYVLCGKVTVFVGLCSWIKIQHFVSVYISFDVFVFTNEVLKSLSSTGKGGCLLLTKIKTYTVNTCFVCEI